MEKSLQQFKQVLINVESNQQVLEYVFVLGLFGMTFSLLVFGIVSSIKKREIDNLKNQINQLPQPIKNSNNHNIGNGSNIINTACKINDIRLVNKFNQDIGSDSLALPKINMYEIVFFDNDNMNKVEDGTIKKAMYMDKNIAIKVGKKFDEFTFNEIKCQMILAGHKNIIDIYGYIIPEMATVPSYIMELMDINLIDYLLKFKSYLLGQHHSMYRIINQVIDGISYMHHNGFVHGDLHPGNILLKNIVRNVSGTFGPTEVKLSHFGHCKYLANDSLSGTSSLGCMLFMSPESREGGRDNYEKGDDVYSVAIVVWLIFTFLSYGEDVDKYLNKFYFQGVSALEYKVLPLHLSSVIRKCIGPRNCRPSIQELGFEVSIAEAKAVQYELMLSKYNRKKFN